MKIIGLMSGTSLDGLDICFAEFGHDNGKWNYKILKAESRDYSQDIKEKLATAQNMSALDYALFNSDYGILLGSMVKGFYGQKRSCSGLYCISRPYNIPSTL